MSLVLSILDSSVLVIHIFDSSILVLNILNSYILMLCIINSYVLVLDIWTSRNSCWAFLTVLSWCWAPKMLNTKKDKNGKKFPKCSTPWQNCPRCTTHFGQFCLGVKHFCPVCLYPEHSDSIVHFSLLHFGLHCQLGVAHQLEQSRPRHSVKPWSYYWLEIKPGLQPKDSLRRRVI